MKKVLLSIVAFTLIFNTVSAEESEVLEVNEEATTIVEESINNEVEVVNNETTKEIILTSGEDVKTYVAQIGETKYETLDEAILAASNNDTIVLLANATTKGIELRKNITIDGNKNTITFNEKGIALFGISLTIKNATVKMTGVTGTPYSEWTWMAISANKNASLNLVNTNMTMDANGKSFKGNHAIYFCGNNKLTLNNSTLEIKNYVEDALEWDGGDGGYNVTFTNSTFTSDNNRSGFTGTFTVKADNSKINVINSTGNGSNGSSFEIINDSRVKFNNNKSHGLSASKLTINNSKVEAKNNGANGVHVSGTLTVTNKSTLTIENNGCSISSKWTIPGALYVAGQDSLIDKTTELTITNNNGSGIYIKNTGSLTLETGTITKNIAEKLLVGGGINNNGTLILSDNVIINNNRAEKSADDIYNGEKAVLKISKATTDVNLIEKREDNKKLNDCTDKIDGWYDDSENNRWNAHDKEKKHIEEVESDTFEGTLSIKAAHGIYGKLIVRYVDTKGNVLSKELTSTEKVDTEYATIEKEFENYSLVKVDGETKGKYIDGTITVTYIYEFTSGTGGEDVPETGINTSNALEITTVLSLITLVTTIILRKRFN